MNSKIFRCGWCGCPTNSSGQNLFDESFKRVIAIVEKYGDSHTTKTHGNCCNHEYENNNIN